MNAINIAFMIEFVWQIGEGSSGGWWSEGWRSSHAFCCTAAFTVAAAAALTDKQTDQWTDGQSLTCTRLKTNL